MDLKPTNIFPGVQPLNICFGCSNAENDEFSSIESDEDDLSYTLLDHYLDKHRTAKPKEITNRPCLHCSIEKTPVGKLNLAGLQLSYDLFENTQHLPKFIDSVDICAPDNFYKLVGCTKDSTDKYTDLIVAKLIPEDVEDERNYELFFEYLVNEEKFAILRLPCKIFKAFYILPLPKENEPPFFMPIANRLNLEYAPREDNNLLGLLVRKPPREEGEISEKEEIPVSDKEGSPSKAQLFSPVSLESDPFSPESPLMSSKKPTSSKGTSKSYDFIPRTPGPKNRYDSYIGRSTEEIPFLTDAIDMIQNKAGPSKKEGTKKALSTPFDKNLEQISSESENELDFVTQESSNRKRSRSIAIEHTQNKVRASSSSSFFSVSRDKSKLSTSLTTTIERVSPEKPKSVSNSSYTVQTCESKKKVIPPEVIDVNDSSNSDPDADFFPPTSNTMLAGYFSTNLGSFEFKYHVISSNRKNVLQYLPKSLETKGRANTNETEVFLTGEMLRPEKKVIAFQLLPNDSSESKRNFDNYVAHLHSRTRYGLLNYKSDTYRAYVFPCVKGHAILKAFEICNLKPSFARTYELYGIIIKKSGPNKPKSLEIQAKSRHRSTSSLTSIETPSPTSSLPLQVPASSSSRDNVQQKESSFETESSDYQEVVENNDLKNFPGLESKKLVEVINESVDNHCKLTANLTTMIHKATDGQAQEAKVDAYEECRRQLQTIMEDEEREFQKRKKAYTVALDILTTLYNSLSDSNN
ncbi:uncharacterized protein LOC107361782 [Tetranychus urticae]|uniref:Spen paralogue and orthologue SPOC C-terminal domain-containing protein n=1 Tax=Tetranychus urticae TaxID=32264 RepID=T1K8A6_TETUR|nr:uncharacterized protein LOC107361782 [Tetranychus urticae]